MQMLSGFFGIDLPMDIRDLVYDITHKDSIPDYKKRILLDIIAFAPVIGDLKYINKASRLGKGINGELNIFDEASDAFKNADEVGDGIADASKRTEKAERPSWRQSEKDAAKDYPNYESQVSYKKMDDDTIQKVSYGTKGSVRPDYYKNGYSVDIKNYNVTTFNGRNNLIRNIEKQFQQRMQNLPINTKQTVVIDIRGQDLTNEILDSLYDDIIKRIRDIDIIIKTN